MAYSTPENLEGPSRTELPTLPERCGSGTKIKPVVIRAMERQRQAERTVHDALDELCERVDEVVSRVKKEEGV